MENGDNRESGHIPPIHHIPDCCRVPPPREAVNQASTFLNDTKGLRRAGKRKRERGVKEGKRKRGERGKGERRKGKSSSPAPVP